MTPTHSDLIALAAEALKVAEGSGTGRRYHLWVDPDDRAAVASAVLTAVRHQELREAAEWYADHARAAAKFMQGKPPNPESMLAVMTTLALDGGARLRRALALPEEGK